MPPKTLNCALQRLRRPVDLARLAGVSTQQIRNYEQAGIFPPVTRTATGYRSYDARHERALLTYRALAAGFGGEASQAIMRAVHAEDLPGALTLIDAGHAALHEQRRSLRVAGEALEAVAEQPPDALAVPRAGMRIGELAASAGGAPLGAAGVGVRRPAGAGP